VPDRWGVDLHTVRDASQQPTPQMVTIAAPAGAVRGGGRYV